MIEQPKGFLSPTGELIECQYMEHYAIAQEICDKNGWISWHPIDALEARGYVHLTSTRLLGHEYFVIWDRPLTPEQIHFLKPIFETPDEELYIPIEKMSRWHFEEEMENN